MKILFPTISSAIRDVENRGIYPDLVRKLASNGHQVYIVYTIEIGVSAHINETGNIHQLGVPMAQMTKANKITRIRSMMTISKKFERAVNKHWSNIQFDLILYATPPISLNRFIRSFKRKDGAYCYLMLKDIFPQNAVDLGMISPSGLTYRYLKRKERLLYKLSDHIGCMSPRNVEYLLNAEGSSIKNKVGLCPNAIEIKRDPLTDNQKASIREANNLPLDKVLVVYGGNLGKPQGVGFLLQALKRFSDNSKLHFLVCGSGTEVPKIKSYIQKEQLSNLSFHEGLSRDTYENLEAAADIALVLLDKSFTIPNYPSRILSYMEHALPILFSVDRATDVGKMAEEGQFGISTEHGDLERFSKQLEMLAENPYRRNEMGLKGRAYLEDNFTTDEIYRLIMSKVEV